MRIIKNRTVLLNFSTLRPLQIALFFAGKKLRIGAIAVSAKNPVSILLPKGIFGMAIAEMCSMHRYRSFSFAHLRAMASLLMTFFVVSFLLSSPAFCEEQEAKYGKFYSLQSKPVQLKPIAQPATRFYPVPERRAVLSSALPAAPRPKAQGSMTSQEARQIIDIFDSQMR